MFKSGSHWVSARMSTAVEQVFPEPPPPPVPEGGLLPEAATAPPLPHEETRLRLPPMPVFSSMAADVAPPPYTKTPPVAVDAQPEEPASAPQEPVSAPEETGPPAPLVAQSRYGTPVVEEPQPPAAAESGGRKGGQELPMPKFLTEDADTPSTRRPSWIVLTTSGLFVALLIGFARIVIPDAGTKMEDVKRTQAEFAQVVPERTADRTKAVDPDDDDAVQPAREMQASEPELDGDPSPSSELTFRDAAMCADAACRRLLGNLPRPVAPTPMKPALGEAIGMLYAADPEERDAPTAAAGPSGTDTAGAHAPYVRLPLAGAGSLPGVPFPLGNLGEVEIVLLPSEGSETARAQVALRARDGRELARFALEVDHALIAGAAEAVVEDEDSPDTAAHDREPGEREPEAALPDRGAGKEKAKPTARRAKSAQSPKALPTPVRAPTQQAPAAPPPRGLFTLGAPAQPAAPPAPPASAKAPAPSPSDMASQPTPRTLDRSPGSETLMGLGGGFNLEQP